MNRKSNMFWKKTSVAVRNVARAIIGKSALINLNLIATNLCNQNCPMCNTTLMRDQKNVYTLELFKSHLEKMKSYPLASCTISGGEPTLIKELPEIIEHAAGYFPFGTLLITNLYGNTKHVMRSVESALRNNVGLSISFDGFGEAADKLRGARNVFSSMEKHINMVHELQQSLNSKSSITLHTVLADMNLSQVPKILEYS
ncbi:MAG: radical SAM protein, partial [Spirochaetota bacterium]|nr:radical SAM protein [Spirochaetota bacterium]